MSKLEGPTPSSDHSPVTQNKSSALHLHSEHPSNALSSQLGNQALIHILETRRSHVSNKNQTTSAHNRPPHQPGIALHNIVRGELLSDANVTSPGDTSEREADHAANKITAYSASPERLFHQKLNQTKNHNDNIPNDLHQGFRRHYGEDVEKITIHHDEIAHRSARSINAKAYTSGNNIVFSRGAFQPHTRKGRHLIAHELAHVMQQRKAGGRLIQRNGGGEPRSLTQTLMPGMLSAAELEVEIRSIRQWLRDNPNSTPERVRLEGELQRLERVASSQPAARRSTGPARATRRGYQSMRVSEPEVVRVRRSRTPNIPGPDAQSRIAQSASDASRRVPETPEQARRAFAHAEQEVSPGVRRRSPPSVSSDRTEISRPRLNTTPQQVQEFAERVLGYRMPRHLASHAEVRQAVGNPNTPIGVSRPMCGSCIRFFVRLANAPNGRVQVVSDPMVTRHFQPGGIIIENWRDGTRVRIRMHPNGITVLGATVIPPQRTARRGGGGSGSGSGEAWRRMLDRYAQQQTSGGSPARVQPRSPGIRAAAGAAGVIMLANEILGPLGRIRSQRARNLELGRARVQFWERFGASPTWSYWDQSNQQVLPQNTSPDSGFLGPTAFPFVQDINVEEFAQNLPSHISTFQSFAFFMDLAKTIGTIAEEPPMPQFPSVEERRIQRRYFAYVNTAVPGGRRRHDITTIINAVRSRTVAQAQTEMREELRGLNENQRSNIFRLRSGSATNIFRSAHGGQSIRSSRQMFGPNPWVRLLGQRMRGGILSAIMQGHYSDRVLVAPANADASLSAQISVYQIYQSIEDTLSEVEQGGRAIISRQPPTGRLQSFVAGPDSGPNARFGSTRYYRHPQQLNDRTVAMGELRRFWVDASDLEPVSASAVSQEISAGQ